MKPNYHINTRNVGFHSSTQPTIKDMAISGQDSSDAKRYQEKDVSLAIQEVLQATDLEEDDEIDEN